LLSIPTRTIVNTELSTTASTVTLSVGTPSLPFTHRHLVVRVNAIATTGTPNILVRFNTDTGANYNYQIMKGAVSSASAVRSSAQTSLLFGILSSTSNEFSGGEFLVPDAFSTRSYKSLVALSGQVEDSVHSAGGLWLDTSAITSVTIFTSASTFASGSVFDLAVVDEMYAVPGAETIVV